jgi:hypothetical protein
MFTIRLHVDDRNYLATERTIKLAQRKAAQLALDDCRNLSLTKTSDEDISSINGND